jgi:hypothetical protein
MAIDVAALSTDELYELGKKLQIKGRSKMSADELRAACAARIVEHGDPTDADELEAELETDTDAAGALPGPAGPDGPIVEQQLTVEQIQKIKASRIESLEAIVSDPELPEYLRGPIQAEIEEREAAAQKLVQSQARVSSMVRNRVTKGGRYVSREGFVTHLAEGVIVTPLTHDLKHVASQGILWEPIAEAAVTYGQLGEQITELK